MWQVLVSIMRPDFALAADLLTAVEFGSKAGSAAVVGFGTDTGLAAGSEYAPASVADAASCTKAFCLPAAALLLLPGDDD